MRRISLRALLIGNVTDLSLWLFTTVAWLIWVRATVHHPGMTRQESVAATVAYTSRTGPQIVILCLGLLVAIVAGFVAGRVAKRNEGLHGFLATTLSLMLGILMRWRHPRPIWFMELILVSAAAGFGGYLARRENRSVQP